MAFTKKEQEQRMVFTMIRLHLNCAETHIKQMRDELRTVDSEIGDEAILFARNKVLDLYGKFKDLV